MTLRDDDDARDAALFRIVCIVPENVRLGDFRHFDLGREFG